MRESHSFTLILPYPDSTLLPNRKIQGYVKREATRQARKAAKMIGLDLLNSHIPESCYLNTANCCSMTIIWYPKTKKIADADSLLRASKPFFDGIVDAGILPNDSWDVIVERTLRRGKPDKDNPRIEIEIRVLE
jgi:hypothetical protein